MATRWRHLHCHIAWDCPLTSSVGIELLSSSARVTSVKSTKGLSVSDGGTSGHKDRTRSPGSDKNDSPFVVSTMFNFLLYYTSKIQHLTSNLKLNIKNCLWIYLYIQIFSNTKIHSYHIIFLYKYIWIFIRIVSWY